VVFELQGTGLAEPPRAGERPSWLRQINGRLESRKVETEQGQQIDSWRLYIPSREGQGSAGSLERPPRVLAIDTQDIIRDLLSSMLTNLGYEASVVGNVGEAMSLFNDRTGSDASYSIIIVDHAPDKIDGLKLAREFKSLDREARVILLTGWGTIDPEEAAQDGVDFVLNKPFRLEQLAEAIRSVSVTS
jgi:CheY-like chemotaxis protein